MIRHFSRRENGKAPVSHVDSFDALIEQLTGSGLVSVRAELTASLQTVPLEGANGTTREIKGVVYGIHYNSQTPDRRSFTLDEPYAISEGTLTTGVKEVKAQTQALLMGVVRLNALQKRFPNAGTVIEDDNGKLDDRDGKRILTEARMYGLKPNDNGIKVFS